MNTEEIIKTGQLKALKTLCSLSGEENLAPILLLASYCGDNPKCTDTNPCKECLEMCNIAFIDRDAIQMDKVICGREFIEDYR